MTPILDQWTMELISNSTDQTKRIGRHLASLLRGGEVIALQGNLGAGKTSLVQGIAGGLGVQGPVTSPTFTLIQEYKVSIPSLRKLYHVDCYRLENPLGEVEAIGLGEILEGPGSVTVIEWADRIERFLPRHRLWVSLDFVSDSKRLVRLCAHGDAYLKLLRDFRELVLGQLH